MNQKVLEFLARWKLLALIDNVIKTSKTLLSPRHFKEGPAISILMDKRGIQEADLSSECVQSDFLVEILKIEAKVTRTLTISF